MNVKLRILSSILSVLVLLTCAAYGEIYGWVDENGVRQYSNDPPPEGVKVFTQTAEIEPDPAEKYQEAKSDRQPVVQQEDKAPGEEAPLEHSAGTTDEMVSPDTAATEDAERAAFHRERIKRRTRQNTSLAPSRENR